MDITILAVPAVVTGVMFVVKKLAGLEWFSNGAENHPFLRFALILLSLIGVVASHFISGTPIDPNSVTDLVALALQAAGSALGSHVIYRMIAVVTGSQTA